ncbi:G-protein coupled receptor dmsr-1 [Patella vulgata]|uniref:G-protein coupled receptor dmsr-1 n=1 Tax=Patella vulgata TaxID=6465 RepID=UPI0021805978|nr:G-protein coupled receptor dmsr-1 [Patella vulgata]XP_050412351.1 G-protein coupled receptor dmsr-1 [Patella vulgata]XP_050412352.1 G-protein coupled receptor dmsr-1 [Patella vulgata]
MNSSDPDIDFYRIPALESLSMWYSGIHGYLSVIVCAFGIPMNLINVTVLTQKHMRTPINCILTFLSLSDMLTMISYVPFALNFYILHSPWELSEVKNSFGWMKFMLFHINFSATTHTVSIWLGVTLAIFRYKHLYSPAKGNLTRIRRLIRARISVCLVYVLSTVGLTPNYITNKLNPYTINNKTVYVMEDLKLGTSEVRPVVLLNLWLYSIMAKLLPCILMVIYGGLLLYTLKSKLKFQKRKLSCSSVFASRPMDNSRTTRMLLIVIILFLVTELPQGILIIISVTSKGFFQNIYMPLGDLMDMVALINNGVNFILYCSMSRDFRLTLMDLLKLKMAKHRHFSTTTCNDSERSQTALIVRVL